MTERIVTTIGDMGLVTVSDQRASARGIPARATPAKPRRRRPRNPRFDDGLDGMMGIGDIVVLREGDVPSLPPSDFPPGTFDVPGSGEIVIPEITITPGPDFTPTPRSSSSPGAARPSKAAWSRGDGSYILQAGDTLFGLAKTYLSSGPRWREIWNVQPAGYKSSHTPDRIFAGEVLAMPAEAQAKARAMGLYGIGASVLGRGFSVKQIAIAAAGVVGLGTVVYFGTR